MEIYILRDGKEIGPFSEETTKSLLEQGSIREADFAWHVGLPKWIPLAGVLRPVPAVLETPPPPPPTEAAPALPTFSSTSLPPVAVANATDKQKALLGYLSIPFSSKISKEEAALLINEATEDPKNASRLAQWKTERLKLHPGIFADEIKEREARADDYLTICQTAGAEYFTKISRAHCQVVVGYLDGKFPNWDEDPDAAPRKYFFPAVAEKFPQLIAPAWQGKLRYESDPKPASEPVRQGPPATKSPAAKSPRKKSRSPFPKEAVTRGLVFAVILIGMFLFVRKLFAPDQAKPAVAPEKTTVHPAENVAPPSPPAAPQNAEVPPGNEPDRKVVVANDPLVPAQDPPAPAVPADPADPRMAADPAPKPAEPLPGFPPDPLAPKPSPPPTDPAAPEPPASAPAPAATPPAAPGDQPAAVKTVLKLTKPVDVQLTYGKMKLPVGTPVKFVSHEGNSVKVNYLNTVLTIPASSTDFGVPEPAPATAPAAPPAAKASDL